MNDDSKRRAGRVLRFAVSGALLVSGPLACGGSTEHTHTNEPVHTNEPMHTNEPVADEPTEEGEGDLEETVDERPPDDGPRVNEPYPG